MNKTIILSELSKSISDLTGCTVEDAKNFLRELFSLAYSKLEQEGRAEIPEVGTWVNDGEQIIFAPDEELAAAINAPFAAFEAIELPGIEEPQDEAEQERQIAESAELEEREDAEPESEPEPEPEP